MYAFAGAPLSLSTLLPAAALLLLVVICLGILVRALWVPLELFRRPSCGACGHGVSDILQGRCPECGGLYAKVGVVTPAMVTRLRSSLPLALLAWSTIGVLGATFVHQWLIVQMWQRYQTQAAIAPASNATTEQYTTSFRPMETSWGPNGRIQSSGDDQLDFRIDLDLQFVSNDAKIESGRASFTLRRNGASEYAKLTIDLAAKSFDVSDAENKQLFAGTDLDRARLVEWFKAAGLDPDDPNVGTSVTDALRICKMALSDPGGLRDSAGAMSAGLGSELGTLQSGGGSSSSGPVYGSVPYAVPMGPTTAELVTWGSALCVTYIIGSVFIVWRHRSLVRPAQEPA